MNNNIGNIFILVRKYRICRYYFFREFLIQFLKKETSQSTACTTRNGMQYNKSFKTIGTISFPINHIHNLFLDKFALRVSTCPVVAGPTAFLRYVYIFRIVQLRIGAILYSVDDPGLQVNEYRSWDIMIIISLIEEHIFPIFNLITYSILLKYAGWTDAMFSA